MSKTIEPIIETTADGSHTLRHPVLGDSYHSLNGAHTEAMHVFVRNGFERCNQSLTEGDVMRILEVGFGSGLNAWLTLQAASQAASQAERRVEYTAIELYPVGMKTVAKLDYASQPHFTALHEATWGEMVEITPLFAINKVESDLADTKFDATFDLVYFDAFAPDTQPELWSVGGFSALYKAMTKGAALVTYSAKGDVKRALRGAGFEVKRLEGAPGKRHMVRAVKI